MEKLEAKANEFLGIAELRCKGWCHDITEIKYKTELPVVEYFS